MSNMKNISKLILLSAVTVSLASCDDLFDPAIENIKDVNSMYNEPTYADGILGDAYILMPYGNGSVNDVATDDAVSNDNANGWRTIAGGAWTSQTGLSNDNWRDRNASIQHLNTFLENADKVTWAVDENVNQMFIDRVMGEAYGLRALNLYFLLQNYGGKTASGELMGVPIWTSSFTATTDMNVPRNTFAECMQQIFDDVKMAEELLPLDYVNIANDSQVPAKYASMGVKNDAYNRVFGAPVWCRMSGRIAKAIRAQAALLAASPAFNPGSGVSWEDAANYAAQSLNDIGGVSGMPQKGHVWFTAEEDATLGASENHPEIIWRGGYEDNCSVETDNFPPSLYGKGRVNPTQNLVDAFPMANGYPINDVHSAYDPANPYANRDPRLSEYITYNGATQGVKGDVINTSADNTTNNDGINKEAGYSTRTGYYMRKHCRSDVNPNQSSLLYKRHYVKRIRYTEIFLAYAEAANEAWGPTAGGSNSYSAYDVIKAIRKRAGLGVGGSDPYLESAKASKEAMRDLIRNERRLELCFENIRFWDLRRWNAPLTETAKGVSIKGNTYNYIEVEPRKYSDYMIYGPLPYNDVLKFSNLEQNQGW